MGTQKVIQAAQMLIIIARVPCRAERDFWLCFHAVHTHAVVDACHMREMARTAKSPKPDKQLTRLNESSDSAFWGGTGSGRQESDGGLGPGRYSCPFHHANH